MRHALNALALSAALTGPAFAFDPAAMSDAERAAFGAEIRAYLLENPEVIFEAVDEMKRREAEAQMVADEELARINADALFNDPNSWTGGNPDGDIRIVEFLDYKCGYCRKVHPDVMQLLSEDGNISLTIKEYPILSEQSELAAQFALATRIVAGDEAYQMVNDTLMNMPGSAVLDDEALMKLAGVLNLDAEAIAEAAKSDEVASTIAENRALAQRLQISGTPSFVFEDQMLRGAVPLEAMKQVIADLRENSEG